MIKHHTSHFHLKRLNRSTCCMSCHMYFILKAIYMKIIRQRHLSAALHGYFYTVCQGGLARGTFWNVNIAVLSPHIWG